MNLFYQPGIPEGILHLDDEESRHCVKVLRKNTGDIIRITDGRGSFYNCRITKADSRQCEFTIVEQTQSQPQNFRIHIAIAPTKNADRIEWFVEKATEFGVDEITLINCEHSERTFTKTERLKKIAVSAMKQSLKPTLPKINDLVEFKALLSTATEREKFIAFVDLANPAQLIDVASKASNTLVAIGPEGDFSFEEIQLALKQGFMKVGLGPSRLRTETAGVAACHILNLVNSRKE